MTTELEEHKIAKGPVILITLLYWLLEIVSEFVVLLPPMIKGMLAALKAEQELSADQLVAEIFNHISYPWYGNLIKLGIIILILYLFKRQNVHFFKNPPVTYQRWLVIVSLSVACVALNFGLEELILRLQPQFDTVNQVSLEMLVANSTPVTMFIMIVILAPFVEEVMVRGVFIGVLFKKKPYLGLVISSLLFALLHGPTDILSLIVYLVPGLTLGLIYIKTDWLGAPILAHGLNNLLAFITIMRG